MRRGISIIELLIVVGVVAALLGMAAPAMLPLAREGAFDASVSMLRDAVMRASSDVVRGGVARELVIAETDGGFVLGVREVGEMLDDAEEGRGDVGVEFERVLLRLDERFEVEVWEAPEEGMRGAGDGMDDEVIPEEEEEQPGSIRVGVLLPSGGGIAGETFEVKDGSRRSVVFRLSELTGGLVRVERESGGLLDEEAFEAMEGELERAIDASR